MRYLPLVVLLMVVVALPACGSSPTEPDCPQPDTCVITDRDAPENDTIVPAPGL